MNAYNDSSTATSESERMQSIGEIFVDIHKYIPLSH